MAKAKQKLDYRQMPAAVAIRSGCKVGWKYYRTEAEAKAAAVIARHNAKIDASQGYDFGYCSPGSVSLVREGEFAGLYEVCTS